MTNSQGNTAGKTIRIATQSLVRPQVKHSSPAQSSNSQQQPKTLVLKTVPLKVKQVAPTTIKMPTRPMKQPATVLQQSPEVLINN